MSEIIEKITEYKKTWNIPETANHENFLRFKNAILNNFKNIDQIVGRESARFFCDSFNIPFEEYNKDTWMKKDRDWTHIYDALKKEDNERNFYFMLSVILSLPITPSATRPHVGPRDIKESKRFLYEKTKERINLCNANIAITIDDDHEITLFPKGEKKLDAELIEPIYSFLDKKSSEKYKEALNEYSRNEYLKSVTQIRRCLEEFLRFKLNNTCDFKNNITELSRHLKNEKNPKDIRNVIKQTFDYIDNYFNNNEKHKDGIVGEAENEYLLYQSALLMRYISKIIK